jgi:hypothetical protein
MGYKMKSSVDKLCSPLLETEQTEQTKRAVINKTSEAYGSSGGYKSTEFVKGGRENDKTSKSTTYKNTKADTDGVNPETFTKSKTKVNRKGESTTKTKVISKKKHDKQVTRKKRRAQKRGDDIELDTNYFS